MIDLDISKKYSIVGVPKCGTSSFGEYLRRLGYDVTEDELYFFDKEHYPHTDRIPLIITRDPIERAWSDYNFFKGFHNTIKEACAWSDYNKGFKIWKDAIIFKLEDLIKINNFPHHNKNPKKEKMTDEIRLEIKKELKI